MWNDIREQIINGDFAKARTLIDQKKPRLEAYDDIFAYLEASVCEVEQDREGMFDAIAKGLQYNPQNYELYYIMGRFYYDAHPDQAFLCLQNALFYCYVPEDIEMIHAEIKSLMMLHEVTVRNVAIIVPSYNSCYLIQKNIESIRRTLLEGTYSIIVVDNASDDGTRQWLEEQKDIILVPNKVNRGFPCACNQGVAAISGAGDCDSDIFLLNNDTRLALNSLFWLRMGLYKDQRIGAVGSCSNYAGNEQQIDVTFTLPGEYLEYGAKINIPQKYPYEERVRLSGFAMLIRRDIWNDVGGMDEAFTPGYFEDDDLCMRILQRGSRLLVCKNSFIYHARSQSFSKENNVNNILLGHHQLFIKKYGFDILEYAVPNRGLPHQIPYTEKQEFSVLQVGCGIGADLKYLRLYYPRAHIVGVEFRPALRRIAGWTEVVFENAEQLAGSFRLPVFDIVVIDRRIAGTLSENDKEILAGLCREGCKIIAAEAER